MLAPLLALGSSGMWGAADFLGGLTSRRRPAAAVFFGSQVVGMAVLAATALVTGAWRSGLDYLPWAVASGLLGTVAMLAFYRALAIGPMGIVSPLVSLSVLVPVVFGLLTGTLPTPIEGAGIAIAILGILLASGPELAGSGPRTIALAGLAALCFGAVYITMAEGSRTSPLMTMTGMRVTTMVILVVVLLAVRSTGGLTARDVPVLAVIGVLDAGANVAYGYATTMGMLANVAVLGSLYPVVTALLAAALLRERLRKVEYIGVALAVVGVLVITATS